jgi:hypothetical protein
MTDKQKNIIKINRQELSSKQVQQKENLEGVLNQHRKITKRPVYKQKKFYFVLFLILLITFLIYYTEKQEKNKETSNTEATE